MSDRSLIAVSGSKKLFWLAWLVPHLPPRW